MDHDPAFASLGIARPRSAVGNAVGLAGLAALLAWTIVAKRYALDGPYSALVGIGLCGLAMAAWSVAVDKAHRAPGTGIDWSLRRPLAETLDLSLTKLAAYWLTWTGLALCYMVLRPYGEGNFTFAMWCFAWAAPVLFVASIPYVLWLDRHLVDPRDGAWALGAWLTGQAGWRRADIVNFLLSWAVKGFFLAFMLGGAPGGFGEFIRRDWSGLFDDPSALPLWLINLMFLIDMGVATIGYMLTFRPLDTHIRSANPYLAAWVAALLCYPPTTFMTDGGLLDYHPGTQTWLVWFAGRPVVLGAIGALLVALTAIYAWASVAFGPRFSNLTNRGILTHGPYAWSRHPAYLSKNLFWWIATLPILTTGSWIDAVRATLLMAAVSGVYYWRARTEERHLLADPAYVAYYDWMEANGPVPRFFRRLRGTPPPATAAAGVSDVPREA